jgi:hypothetical protein
VPLNLIGEASRFLIEHTPTLDGLDAATLADRANARGYEGVTASEMEAAIADLSEKHRDETLAQGVGGEIGKVVCDDRYKGLSDKDICYLILGKCGVAFHPIQVKVVRDRLDTKM